MNTFIAIDREAADHIKKSSSSIVIELKWEPAIGGCCAACSTKNITGSYIPLVSIAEPLEEEKKQYCVVETNSIQVYYPATLRVKEGFTEIRIKLKKTLFWGWLEVEGAKAIANYY